MGLVRLAGNMFECKSTKDFWKVSEKDGSLVRMTSGEVDNGEHIQSAPKEAGADFLQDILAGLEF